MSFRYKHEIANRIEEIRAQWESGTLLANPESAHDALGYLLGLVEMALVMAPISKEE